MRLVTIDFSAYNESVTSALDMIKARDILAKQSAILIKPNLVNASPHPVTTPVACCEAVVEYVRSCSKADIVVAEGPGDPFMETEEVFDCLGYRSMAIHQKVPLVDLNTSPLKKLENKQCSVFSEIYLPKMAFTHFIISLPVLKAHTLAIITGTLKNMIGLAPPKYYSGGFGAWKKAVFHGHMQQAIVDLNRYRSPDLSLMDATLGLSDSHLGGRRCTPPIRKLIAGFNPLEVDRKAATLLGLDWKRIPHHASESLANNHAH